jgi:hypothetical protein
MAASRDRRGMALYIAVVSTTTIVSVLALSAMAVVRIERKQAVAIEDRMTARSNARSAVELALVALANDSNWRNTYSSGVETTPLSLGPSARGTISWKLSDADNNLKNADVLLSLKGIGRLGGIVQVSGLQLQVGTIGPTTLRSQTGVLSLSQDDVKDSKWWAQKFRAALPSEANGWRVSSVEIYARRQNTGRTVTARLYRGVLSMANVMESVNLASGGFPSSYAWYPIPFAGTTWLDTNETLFFALESTDNTPPISIEYIGGGVSDANCALVQGNPAWGGHQTSKALRYRINGFYTTSSDVKPVAASWIWTSP